MKRLLRRVPEGVYCIRGDLREESLEENIAVDEKFAYSILNENLNNMYFLQIQKLS